MSQHVASDVNFCVSLIYAEIAKVVEMNIMMRTYLDVRTNPLALLVFWLVARPNRFPLRPRHMTVTAMRILGDMISIRQDIGVTSCAI